MTLSKPETMFVINATGETGRGREHDFDELFKVHEVEAVSTGGKVWHIWNPERSSMSMKAFNLGHDIFKSKPLALDAALKNALLYIKQESAKQLQRVKTVHEFYLEHQTVLPKRQRDIPPLVYPPKKE